MVTLWFARSKIRKQTTIEITPMPSEGFEFPTTVKFRIIFVNFGNQITLDIATKHKLLSISNPDSANLRNLRALSHWPFCWSHCWNRDWIVSWSWTHCWISMVFCLQEHRLYRGKRYRSRWNLWHDIRKGLIFLHGKYFQWFFSITKSSKIMFKL